MGWTNPFLHKICASQIWNIALQFLSFVLKTTPLWLNLIIFHQPKSWKSKKSPEDVKKHLSSTVLKLPCDFCIFFCYEKLNLSKSSQKHPHSIKIGYWLIKQRRDPDIGESWSRNPTEYTLPETNIAPTNGWLEYYFPIGEAYFQGLR